MKTIIGDLIELALRGEFDVIVHGCNCFHTMGAGIAKQIRQNFPEAEFKDRTETKYGDRHKLGTINSVLHTNMKGIKFYVVNAYTQYSTHSITKKVLADYDAIRKAFSLIKRQFKGKRIGYPMIGAGLAKGDWKIISKIIDEELDGEDHNLVIYDRR